jgi:hypothetical protein
MFRTTMTTECAQTLASFLRTAGVIFAADAKVCSGDSELSKQFAKQARQAVKLAAQFERARPTAAPLRIVLPTK